MLCDEPVQILNDISVTWPLGRPEPLGMNLFTEAPDDDGTQSNATTCADLCILRVLLELVVGLPSNMLRITSPTSDADTSPAHTAQTGSVVLGDRVISALKDLHVSPIFRGSYKFAPSICKVLEILDPTFCAGVNMEMRAVAACQALRDGVKPHEDGVEALKRFLTLSSSIVSYLSVQHNGSKDSLGGVVTVEDHDLDTVVEALASSVVVLYAASVILDDECALMSSAYLNTMLQLLTLRREWALHLVSSLALFLDISPPDSHGHKRMHQLQDSLYHSFVDMPKLDSDVRDIVLCTLVDPCLLHVLVVNVLLRTDLSECRQDGVLHLTSAAEIQAFELCGVLLGVSKQDLLELSSADVDGTDSGGDDGEQSVGRGARGNEVRRWSTLLCPLKVLSWKVFGDGSDTSDETMRMISSFTLQLEVRCDDAMLIKYLE